MFICMAGMPSSGKTEFVKKFLEITQEKEIIIIDPKEYLPDDINDLSADEQKRWRVASWEVCLKLTKNAMHKPSTTTIILDTAAASDLPLTEIFTFAKLKGHYIIHVFVTSKINECKNRAGKLWIGTKSAINYAQKFKTSVPNLRKLSNKYITVKNTGEEGRKTIEKEANQLEAIVSRYV